MAKKYIALIPAYEPDEKMLKTIEDLMDAGFETVVVDDGSGEDYREFFAVAADTATILTHEVNKGKGAALKTGLEYINNTVDAGKADTVIVTVDADGQHLARDARRVSRIAGQNPGTLVLGSRILKDAKVPLRSRLGNGITRKVFKVASGCSVYDTQTGLRAFTSNLIPTLLEIRGDRYEYEINMLLEFAASGIPIREEEIETVYIEDNKSSHFNTLKDSWRIYREILKFSASSFASFLVDYGLYALLTALTGSLAISNIGARVVSATFNFTINRRYVFKSDASTAKSALKYFALAAFILAGNTAVLTTLVSTIGINRFVAKVITEIVFFVMSWLVQRYAIFYREAGAEEEKAAEQKRECVQGRSFVIQGSHQKKLKGARKNG